MLEFNCARLSSAGFSVFRQLFLQNNEKAGKIKRVEVCGSEEYSVCSAPVCILSTYSHIVDLRVDRIREHVEDNFRWILGNIQIRNQDIY